MNTQPADTFYRADFVGIVVKGYYGYTEEIRNKTAFEMVVQQCTHPQMMKTSVNLFFIATHTKLCSN